MGIYQNMKAIIYMRLSREDKNDESLSITNQREVIQNYCNEQQISIIREFFDDGYSGGNFQRPGFQAMINYIKICKPDIVITKDLSRLGRDMTESSQYAEKIFPSLGVRYLAIRDNFDSSCDNPLAPFQFAMNDVYIREASKKIRDVLTQKKKNGKYCACPPFGYMKSNRQRDKLVPDQETAPIVQRIFAMAASGMSTRKIAEQLTSENVITPLMYRVLYRDEFSESGARRATDVWNNTTIKRIIRNRVYMGDTCLGKTKKISVKSAVKMNIPSDEWYITPNTHEPLVSSEVFERANEIIDSRVTDYNKAAENNGILRESIFRGVIFCKNCGAAMCSGGSIYNSNARSYWYLTCVNIPKRSKHQCVHGARIKYFDLVEIIKNDLNSLISLSDDKINKIIESVNFEEDAAQKNKLIQKQCSDLQQEIDDSNKIIEKLYVDNLSGKISNDRMYSIISSIEEKSKRNSDMIIDLQSQIVDCSEKTDNYKRFFSIVKSYSHIETLTPEIIHAFIDKIEVGRKSVKNSSNSQQATQDIIIYYKFIGAELSA